MRCGRTAVRAASGREASIVFTDAGTSSRVAVSLRKDGQGLLGRQAAFAFLLGTAARSITVRSAEKGWVRTVTDRIRLICNESD